MIKSFRSKALAQLFDTGRSAGVDARLQRRILVRLDRLNAATHPSDMKLPGFDFHVLRGFDPARYTAHVNGPWCITFEFRDGDALGVDLEQYH